MKKRLALAIMALAMGINVYATDWLTETFNYNFDLNNFSVIFTPDGPDNYTISAEAITELPVDIDAVPHVYNLSLRDDDAGFAYAPEGTYLTYFGTDYYRCRVGSNGYITFNSTDTDFTPSLSDHFDTLRIALYWVDLNPATGGNISYVKVSNPNRFVINYENVPRYGNTNLLCNAQCEMFLQDGTIRLSWIDCDDMGYTIIGLSAAQGYNSTNYVGTDFSSYTSDDLDADGMSDTWEETYFGSCENCNPTNDFDLDGFNNLAEYIADTHPKDNTSFFHISSMYMTTSPTPGMILNWNAAQGRLYTVKWTDSINTPFTSLVTDIAYPQNSYTSIVESAEGQGYYKIEVELE